DTRLSGYMLEPALVAGFVSMGMDVVLVGPMPTPGIAFLTSSIRADAGVVVSASHNPFQDNGIKFFGPNGTKLPDEIEEEIERLALSDELDQHRPTAGDVGKAFRIDDAAGRYIVYLKHTFPRDFDLDGLRVVVDCAHGAAYKVAPAVFAELGAEVIPIGINPDGQNINDGVGAVAPRAMQTIVRDRRADIGIALDGDADRLILADERGNIVDGDAILAICAKDLAERGELRHKAVVGTVMSNMGLEVTLRKLGVSLIRTGVGDRYVAEALRERDLCLGGEQSGHLIFADLTTTGDGILSALQILAIMRRTGKRLSELASILIKMPQVLKNVPVKHKPPIDSLPESRKLIKEAETALGDFGRVLVRYSGTEHKVRVMIEGERAELIERHANAITEALRKELG
ncbi:MAG: phosphoglucosamine mutase, partial [Myxococcales bacterium]|nr:phosphoglucosamine mutase [Myxococcales bacterium]